MVSLIRENYMNLVVGKLNLYVRQETLIVRLILNEVENEILYIYRWFSVIFTRKRTKQKQDKNKQVVL